MKFESIEQIIDYFNLEEKESNELKKKLKSLLIKYHPDKNKGEFKSDVEKQKYNDLDSAIQFLNENNTETAVIKPELHELSLSITKLIQKEEEIENEKELENFSQNLNQKLEKSIISFQDYYKKPRITGIIITTIITAIWAFPNIVKQHPILKFLYDFHLLFTTIWITVLIILGLAWLKIKIVEEKDNEFKKNLNLESTQNNIFKLFLYYQSSNYDNVKFDKEHNSSVIFSKDDLTSFILSRFKLYENEFKNKTISKYEIDKYVREFEKNLTIKAKSSKFFPTAEEITTDVAELISSLILKRLLLTNVITKLKEKSLSQRYQIDRH